MIPDSFQKNDPVWYLWSAAEGYVEARVISVQSGASTGKWQFELEIPSKGHSDPSSLFKFDWSFAKQDVEDKSKMAPLLHMNPQALVGSNNLTELSHLNEQEVLRSLRKRYEQDQVYTKSGLVLVAMNPFKIIPSLYSDQSRAFYRTNPDACEDGPGGIPHVFAVAENAFKDMRDNNRNHSIIINGESGAGKTVAAKYILQYYTEESEKVGNGHVAVDDIEHKILATNPILEALGNAKTQRNDNSSRFGKYLRLEFNDKWGIAGASMETYLLEKSRLCSHPEGERNFHVFYQMFAGGDDQFKKLLALTSPSDFAYLQPYREGEDLGDAKCFQELLVSLETFGLDSKKQLEFFSILAGVLHLGNVKISGGADESLVNSPPDPALAKACELLGLDAPTLVKVLMERTIVTREGPIVAKNSREKAIEYRDAIAKFIYLRLFSWILALLNKSLCSPKFKGYIGILDIYGFEFFKTNSLEQFCINYANEKLQQEFNKHFFKKEQIIYQNEGIPLEHVKFNDNQPCIDLIEGKGGIVDQLDEQAKVAFGTDQKFRDGLFSGPKPSDFLIKPKMGTTTFEVRHFAANVIYDVTGFVDKNRDALSDELRALLVATKNSVLSQVLSGDAQATTTTTKASVMNSFRESLRALCDSLGKTESHYIRCIKPNDKFQNMFDPKYTLHQLLACGIIETVKMAIAGFPTRRSHAEMADRFGVLVDRTGKSPSEIAEAICVFCKLEKNTDYAIGKTLTFMRIGILARLEKARDEFYSHSLRVVIGCYYGKKTREKFLNDVQAIYKMVNIIRAKLAHLQFRNLRETTLYFQQVLRIRKVKKIFRPTVIIQRNIRSHFKLSAIEGWNAAITMQSSIRSFNVRKDFKTFLFASMVQQGYRRMRKRVAIYEHLISQYVLTVQTHIRRFLAGKNFRDPQWVRESKRAVEGTKKRIKDAEFARQQMEEQRIAAEKHRIESERKERVRQHDNSIKAIEREEVVLDKELADLEATLCQNDDYVIDDLEKNRFDIPLKTPEQLDWKGLKSLQQHCLLFTGLIIACDAFAIYMTHQL